MYEAPGNSNWSPNAATQIICPFHGYVVINQINQFCCEDERGAFPCPFGECGGPQHHPQLQFVGFPVRRSGGDEEGPPVVNDRKPSSRCLPNFPSSNQARTCGSVGLRLERRAEGERGAAGITAPRDEASYPRGVLAGGAAPTLPVPGRLCWGPAEMPLLCWVCAAGEEERVCGLLAAEALGILLLLRFRTTKLLQLCWRLGQACLSLHKRKLTLRVSSWGRFCSKGKLEHFDTFSLPVL